MARLIIATICAILLSLIELLVMVSLFLRYEDRITKLSKYAKGMIATCICVSLIVLTWGILISKNDNVLRSKVNRDLIAALTEEKLGNNLQALVGHTWVENYRINDVSDSIRHHNMYYRRRNDLGEYTGGSVHISISVFPDETSAKARLTKPHGLYDYYIFEYSEAYIQRPTADRGMDTFLLAGPQRVVDTKIRVDEYVISLSEYTQWNQLNDLRTNDVFRILIGE